MKQINIPIISEIRIYKNRPQLFINNKIVLTDSYLTYIDENNDYEAFSNAGFELFSTSIFAHSRIINENTKLSPFAIGVLDKKDNLSLIDKKINSILKNNPNAYIFPRLNIELSKKWEEQHIDELNDEPLHYGDHRACLSSSEWLSQVKREIKTIISYIQNQDYAKNIIGYQIAGGMTEEWMAFDFKGCNGKRSRELFLKEVTKGNYKNDAFNYKKFLNHQITLVICNIAKYIKHLTDNRLIIGTFYGYSYALTSWGFGHSNLSDLLESKYIDFICSPLSYWTNREVGEPCPYMSPVSSILLHKKMYFAENDTRTHLSTFFSDNAHYQTPLWKGPNESYSLEMMKFHYSKALSNGVSYWWFDLWGGWYMNDSYHNLVKQLADISKNNLEMDNVSLKQVAIITDEEESLYCDVFTNDSEKVRKNPLKNIEKAGMSYDLYLASDFEHIKNDYNCYIIFYYKGTTTLNNIIEYLKNNNANYLIINEENCNITSAEIRTFYNGSKLKIFNSDIVINENNNYLTIYGVENTVINKMNIKLFDLLAKKEISFPIEIKKGYSYLFKKIH